MPLPALPLRYKMLFVRRQYGMTSNFPSEFRFETFTIASKCLFLWPERRHLPYVESQDADQRDEVHRYYRFCYDCSHSMWRVQKQEVSDYYCKNENFVLCFSINGTLFQEERIISCCHENCRRAKITFLSDSEKSILLLLARPAHVPRN